MTGSGRLAAESELVIEIDVVAELPLLATCPQWFVPPN
jgi:hypothetical protein